MPSRAFRLLTAFRMATNTFSACAVDASRACRGRRMLREILLPIRFGWARPYRLVAMWVDHPRWSRLGYLVMIFWF